MDALFKLFISKKNDIVKKIVECSKEKCSKNVKDITFSSRKAYVKCIKNKKKNSTICLQEASQSKEVLKSKKKLQTCMKKKCIKNII
jgi:hypothetical protein